MRFLALFSLFLIVLCAQTDPGAVRDRLTRFKFPTVADPRDFTVDAITTDSDGHIYLAGTTSLPHMVRKEASLVGATAVDAAFQPLRSQIGEVFNVAASPGQVSLLLAVTGEAIYQSADGGATWKRVYTFVDRRTNWVSPVQAIAFNPHDHRRAFASSVDGLLTSHDGGDSWQTVTLPPSGNPVYGCSSAAAAFDFDPLDPRRMAYGSLYSSDGGMSFMHLPVGGARFDASGRIWGCSGSEIQVSADEGRTWTQKATPVTSPDSLFQVLPGPANVVFAVTSLRGLFRSTDEGATWTLVNYTVYGKIAAPCGIDGPLVSMSPRVPSRSIRWSGDEGATWRDFDVFNVFDISFGPRCSPIVARDIASDIWISKFTADGRTQLWQTIIGGGAADSTVWSEGAGLITDVAGNLYLVGHTASTDFPDQRFGTGAQSGYFVSKLDPDGALVFTTLLPGITVAAITTDRAGNVVAVGTVSSDSVPVTADADQPEFMATGAGFVLRLSLSGQVVYASYFNQGALSVALAFQDRVLLGGSKFPGESRQHFLGELLEDGRIHDLAALPGSPVSIAADAIGQLAVAGVIPALNSCSFFADFPFKGREGGDLYIARFQGPDFKPSPVKSITSDCQSRPQAVAFRSDGVLVLLASTLAFTFPLKQPLFTGFASGFSRGESTVLVYLDTNNGMLMSTYAYGDVLTANDTAFTADIRELTAWPVDIESPAIRLDNVVNAFSGKGSSVLPGSLVTLSGTNLGPVDTIDLGLNSRTDLPKELGGTRVLFNGRPAPIFATSWSRIVCVAPYGLVGEVGIQVEFEGMRSNPVVTAVGGNFGLLTRNFPDLPSSWKSVQEGNVRNADDTPNSAGNPARPGSTFYVFATGFTSPQVEPGSIATSEVASEGFVYAPGFSADTFGQVRGATTIPGFVTALFRVPLTAPSTPGRHEVHLDTVWYKRSDHSASNPIWVYVK